VIDRTSASQPAVRAIRNHFLAWNELKEWQDSFHHGRPHQWIGSFKKHVQGFLIRYLHRRYLDLTLLAAFFRINAGWTFNGAHFGITWGIRAWRGVVGALR
jgi:hypothetical protein